MSSSNSIIRWLPVAGLIVAALGLAGCSQEKAEVRDIIRPVKVVEIGAAQTTRQLDYSGSVRARTEMNLGFLVAGKVTERLVDIGQHVTSGDVLARIDPSDYELSVKSAAASLDAAERQVETVDLARKRAEQLYAKNFAPKSQLEQATLAYNQAVAARDAARSTLAQAQNQVHYTDLKASENGIVTAVSADVGQVVGAGTPVMTVAVDGEKEVLIAVPEMDIAGFRPGKEVKASFWADDALTLAGKVREVAGSADPQSRTFAVRVSLPNDPRVLLGMTANVQASIDSKTQLVSIPLSALAEKDGQKIVWTVDRGSDTVHSRPVKIANFTADGVAVADGLKQGDVVVAAGTQFMTDNLKVKLSGDSLQQSASAADDAATSSLR
ncbi:MULTISPECIES: efflux RND transporter periplasmic adaptor subunit [unclassified Mesorhizobium]|uniref:efflux RND transporter periplasmic adaptor subunit n=1 Tax=unclassified Mesorhizobium TaxID=325217 RepID=UPI00112A07C3|nr:MULTISPECIES: efflux RND transporter periplasmic adaptor subunit [unclassified Mesorhizobium]TPK51464.1 efflux RND transporter periplasmic adaptor subunit [Mesorhizobium sp. B2-5-2]TPL25670.1 efflux RND transporter periplasmic adaptor subunit [Mesorhizobium sp. B2-4-9]TPL30419.1 efflux RND transporter periplasmic adaptor subunit [Mesorhizobium sp. B2-4-7]TPL44738.1 efflux RND transporter periplasmic adaptor subunit [Mesorhizobium sp. B2-4-5]TPM76157.1 efflux RND transporter periplasmic adap